MLRKRSVLLHLLLHTGMGTKPGDFVQRGVLAKVCQILNLMKKNKL